jgi:hypothetical protein
MVTKTVGFLGTNSANDSDKDLLKFTGYFLLTLRFLIPSHLKEFCLSKIGDLIPVFAMGLVKTLAICGFIKGRIMI